MKLSSSSQRASKNRENRSHGKRPNRVDVAKIDIARHEGGDTGPGIPPPNKLPRVGNHRPPGDALMDPNSSDHVVAMTQLKEQMASLQKQMAQRDAFLLTKDKQITELKAQHFTNEQELRNRMNTTVKDYEKKIETMSLKIKSLQKEVATLSKSAKKGANRSLTNNNSNSSNVSINNVESGAGSGSGTDSPLPRNSPE